MNTIVVKQNVTRNMFGPQVADGWTPLLAAVEDGERRVFQITDWIGGTGDKPPVGLYLGPNGLVNTPAEATDIGVPTDYSSRDALAGARVPTPVQYVRTAGYHEAGDGGGALYKRVAFEPDHGGKVQSADGAWWEIAELRVNPVMFGALRGRENASDTTGALKNAIAYCELSGASLDLLGGEWFISDTLVIEAPIVIEGRGKGYWHANPPGGNGRSSVAGTTIVLTGTGPKDHWVHGVSSGNGNGGTVPNPSAEAGFNDDAYPLLSFMEDEPDGNEPRRYRMFSAGLWIKPSAAGWRLQGFRVMPDGGGDIGMDRYRQAGNTSTPWAADWDCGVVAEMSPGIMFDMEVVGDYRMAAELVLAIPADPTKAAVPALWGSTHYRCTFAGFRAVAVRGPDQWRVTDVGDGWIEVPWADDHPFDPATYDRFGIGATFSLNGAGWFTGVEKNGDALRLTGVTAPVSIDVGATITSRIVGAGTSHCYWDEACQYNGIHHPSGHMAHDQALGANAFPSPSTVIEASGWRMTELVMFGALQTMEEVALHTHSLSGSRLIFEWEGSVPTSGKGTSRIITSPAEQANTRVPHPAGKTQFCIIDAARGFRNQVRLDLRPRLSEAVPDFPDDNGFFEGMDLQVPSLALRTSGDNGTGPNPNMMGLTVSEGLVGGILDEDGAPAFAWDRIDNRIKTHRHLAPDTTNVRDLGSTDLRYRAVHSRQFFVDPGGTRLFGGAGSPEGSATAVPGSVYLRTDPADANTVLYVKVSGTGNTGWTAK